MKLPTKRKPKGSRYRRQCDICGKVVLIAQGKYGLIYHIGNEDICKDCMNMQRLEFVSGRKAETTN